MRILELCKGLKFIILYYYILENIICSNLQNSMHIAVTLLYFLYFFLYILYLLTRNFVAPICLDWGETGEPLSALLNHSLCLLETYVSPVLPDFISLLSPCLSVYLQVSSLSALSSETVTDPMCLSCKENDRPPSLMPRPGERHSDLQSPCWLTHKHTAHCGGSTGAKRRYIN